jgi:hypothetical protein
MSIPSVVISFLVVASTCIAQTDSIRAATEGWVPGNSVLATVRKDGLTVLNAVGHVVTAPTRWDGADWLVVGGVVGVTAAGFLLDDEALNLMERNHSSFNNDVTRIAAEYGSGYVAIGLPVAMYIYGLALEDKWVRETAVLMGSTLLLTSAITAVGKVVVGRARPYPGFGNHEFRPFNGRAGFVSFPSGHTTVAFAISAVLAERIKNPWASVGLYGAATAAAVSRMYTQDHWLSDVVFTAAYTTAVTHAVVKWFEKENEEDAHTFNIVPTMNGVSVVLKF